MKNKILIIENDDDSFLDIKKALEDKLGEYIEAFPRIISDEDSFINNNYLIGKIVEPDWKSILDFYKDIDLFIIDVYLLDDIEKIGIEFAKYIQDTFHRKYKIIIMSRNQIPVNIINNSDVTFFSKLDKGIYYPQDLVKVVRNLLNEINGTFNLENEKQTSIPKIAENSNEDINLNNSKSEESKVITVADLNSSKKTYIPKIEPSKDWKHKLHEFWEYLRYETNRAIDKLIYISFYILLVTTTVFAVVNILVKIWEIAFDKTSKNKDSEILKTSEHIFLYLLPIFIVFGFFHYYKNNSRVSLLEGKIDGIDEENSTKTMNLTKILFISSIISYVLIKIIEELFFSEKVLDLTRLISFGVLLLMLMTYFLFLEKISHPDK